MARRFLVINAKWLHKDSGKVTFCSCAVTKVTQKSEHSRMYKLKRNVFNNLLLSSNAYCTAALGFFLVLSPRVQGICQWVRMQDYKSLAHSKHAAV